MYYHNTNALSVCLTALAVEVILPINLFSCYDQAFKIKRISNSGIVVSTQS